jgi:hypothetical protein
LAYGAEAVIIGPAVDIRGTKEARNRFERIKDVIPKTAFYLAMDELNEKAKF